MVSFVWLMALNSKMYQGDPGTYAQYKPPEEPTEWTSCREERLYLLGLVNPIRAVSWSWPSPR